MRKTAVHKLLVIVSVLILTIPFINAFIRIARDPDVPFLLPEKGAEWIRIERPVNLATWRRNEAVAYRHFFTIEREPPDALLTVRALRTSSVQIDGKSILGFSNIVDWKKPRTVSLKGHLTPGVHELRVVVLNENGPTVLLAYSKTLQLFTGKNWEASVDGSVWRPVMTADEKKPPELSRDFPDTVAAFGSLSYIYLPLFLISLVSILFFRPAIQRYPIFRMMFSDPPTVRWLLLGAWVLLAVNNMNRIPLGMGYDAFAHYEYISYIAKKWAIPLANEGWQMFQPPLFYIVSALLRVILSPFFSPVNVAILLRIIPLACGMAQVELVYRSMRHVFPERNDLQIIGTLVGGLLPMNIYISQTVGNEPLAGVFSTMAVVMTLRILRPESGSFSMRRLILMGVLLGLACLTKFTAVLLIPPIILALIYLLLERGETVKGIAKSISAVLCSGVLLSGWYYIRNWVELGKPFIGGWDPSRNIVWWQDPGYRTIGDFITFGRSLTRPIYAGLDGLWDSIYSSFWLDGFLSSMIGYEYRPPWNYDFMIAGAIFSLIPAAGIVIGFITTVFKPGSAKRGQVFSVYCIVVYFVALLYLYVTLPIYSTAKATYTIGLIPCYAILCATGLDILSMNKYTGAIVYALVICWVVTAYASFFVL